jgi:NADH-quinone oxidoreductase subunit L
MTIPLIILAILSVVTGLWNMNGGFTEFLEPGHHFVMHWDLAIISLAVASAGILFGVLIYGVRVISAEALGSALKPLHTLVSNKYYLDDLNDLIVKYVVIGISSIVHWIDQKIIDGIVNGVGRVTVWLGGEMSQLETGRLQNYALGAFGGAVVIVFVIYFSGVQ